MDPEAKHCTRPGCGKKLRSSNTKGTCGSGCLSSEAPAYQRAKDVEGGTAPVVRARPKKREVEAPSPEGLERFRVVATALGKDPDALIAAFAESWLEALRERLEEADS